MCVCVRACVRVCVCVCMRVRVCVCVCARARARLPLSALAEIDRNLTGRTQTARDACPGSQGRQHAVRLLTQNVKH